jgi:hypothetical protein
MVRRRFFASGGIIGIGQKNAKKGLAEFCRKRLSEWQRI